MKFIDLFAGIGGLRLGMEMAGHECVGFCEYDKFAVASYTSMHLITDEQRDYLGTLSMKQRQKEILKEEYRGGEWYRKDIRKVRGDEVPKVDCWCFGAVCTSFSVAGKREGLEGASGIIQEVFRILGEIREEDRPEWLIYENVKGMFSSNKGFDYLAILSEMDELGYDIQWQNFNSRYYVPQNRERVYTLGHLRTCGGNSAKVFPVEGTDGEISLPIIKRIAHANKFRRYMQTYDKNGIVETLDTGCGGGHNPYVMCDDGRIRKLTPKECWRLQGFPDEMCERAAFVNSDSQLYKQAGNSVTVPVVYEIANALNMTKIY